MACFLRAILIVISFFLFLNKTYSQITAKNSIFIELLGNSASLSVNYDRILVQKNKIKLCSTAGIGYYYPFWDRTRLNVPVDYGYYGSLNALLGKKKHYIEIGVGITYNSGGNGYDVPHNGKTYPTEGLYLVPRFGYRYQRNHTGFFFRIGFTPLLLLKDYSHLELLTGQNAFKTPFFSPMAGISLGYSF